MCWHLAWIILSSDQIVTFQHAHCIHIHHTVPYVVCQPSAAIRCVGLICLRRTKWRTDLSSPPSSFTCSARSYSFTPFLCGIEFRSPHPRQHPVYWIKPRNRDDIDGVRETNVISSSTDNASENANSLFEHDELFLRTNICAIYCCFVYFSLCIFSGILSRSAHCRSSSRIFFPFFLHKIWLPDIIVHRTLPLFGSASHMMMVVVVMVCIVVVERRPTSSSNITTTNGRAGNDDTNVRCVVWHHCSSPIVA